MTSDNWTGIQEKPAKEHQSSDNSLLSLVADCGRAAAYSALEMPVNGVTQLVDHIAGHSLLGQMHTFDLHQPSSTADEGAQQIGSVVGMIVPFMLSRTGVRFAKQTLGLAESRSLLGVAADNAAAGFAMGFALTPSEHNSNSFWTDRLKSAGVAAGTFAVLGGTSQALEARMNPTGEALAARPLSTRVMQASLRNSIAGLPAGFVSAELQSVADGHGLASTEHVLANMAGFAAFGAIMAPLDVMRPGEVPKPRTETETQARFRQYTPEQLAAGRANVLDMMAKHRAFNETGTQPSLLDKFKAAGLNETQQTRVLNSLAQVYENFASYRNANGTIDLDQKGNWFHTLDEADEVLSSSKQAGLTPDQTERALMAMFGDADKTKSNFMVHNLDGARAAKVVLSRQTDSSFTPEHIHWIEEANKEHQIGPPGLMAQIYTGAIRGQINAERTAEFNDLFARNNGGSLSASEQQRLSALTDLKGQNMQRKSPDGPFVTSAESTAIKGIFDKLSDPFGVPLEPTTYGGMAVRFDPLEKQLFARTGNQYWYVPHEGTPWYLESRIGIDADSKANYTRVGGFKKLLGLNGPETDVWFQFTTLQDCLKSPLRSFEQAYKIMTPDAQAQSQSRLADTQAAIDRALGRTETWVRQQIGARDWLQQSGKNEDQILSEMPFWKTALSYPAREANTDHEWWRIHKIPAADRSPQDAQFYEQHRYDGLTPLQIKQFQFAKEIRERMVDELGAEQRLDGQLPQDLAPVMNGSGGK